jgi:hypothetical protein
MILASAVVVKNIKNAVLNKKYGGVGCSHEQSYPPKPPWLSFLDLRKALFIKL